MATVGAHITTRAGRRLRQVAAELDQDALDAIRALGDDAELIFAAHAPARSGRLARGIVSGLRTGLGGKPIVVITASAKDPLTGFDYVAVTRFGHRQAWIEPREDRGVASTVATRRGRGTGRRSALRFVIGGRVLYRRRVRGYRPRVDWVQTAMPDVQQQTRETATRLGRRIVSKLA